jgi:hypothetical protein
MCGAWRSYLRYSIHIPYGQNTEEIFHARASEHEIGKQIAPINHMMRDQRRRGHQQHIHRSDARNEISRTEPALVSNEKFVPQRAALI